jgi:glutamate synthase domain-containing protein 1
LIVSLFYFIKSRDDFLIQLRKQQSDELAKHVELIESTRRQIEKSKETRPVEKRKKIIALNNVKKKIISKIKQKQKNQVKEITHLKKLNKKDEIKNKLNSWRKEGYKLFETEGEIKKVNNSKKQMEIWKKQGYKAD